MPNVEKDAPSDDFYCPRCDDDKGEHTRLYGCRFDDLHDWPGGVIPPARHNHDPIGLYANCPACGTVIPPDVE